MDRTFTVGDIRNVGMQFTREQIRDVCLEVVR
jgi:hypothetical protein